MCKRKLALRISAASGRSAKSNRNNERVALHTLHQHDAPGSDFVTAMLAMRLTILRPGNWLQLPTV